MEPRHGMRWQLWILSLLALLSLWMSWGMMRVPLSDPPIKYGSLSAPYFLLGYIALSVVQLFYSTIKRLDRLEEELVRLRQSADGSGQEEQQ
jgi:hypothetical protein